MSRRNRGRKSKLNRVRAKACLPAGRAVGVPESTVGEQLRISAVSVSSGRSARRRATWLSIVGLLSVPLAAHGAVSLVEFQPSTPIVASEVNENFASLNASLDGPLVFGDQPIDTPAVGLQAAPFTNAIVGLTTTGGRVHVWLVPRFDPDPAGTESGFAILGAGDTAAAGIIYLERSADGGETWEQRGNIIVSGSGPASYFPPSNVSFMDEAPAGDWTYRLSGRISGPADSLQLLYVQLVARELASG